MACHCHSKCNGTYLSFPLRSAACHRARFFFVGCELNRTRHPSRSSLPPCCRGRPGGFMPPQKNVGARLVSKPALAGVWLPLARRQSCVAHGPGDPVCLQPAGQRPHPIRSMACTSHSAGLLPLTKSSRKTALDVEWFLLAQHVVTRSGQLVCQRLGRHDPILLTLLALVKALRFRAEAHRIVGRFDKRPG